MTCNKAGHKAQYYLSCDADGVLSVGPNADSIGSGEVVLPDCSNWNAATKTPICDRTALGIYSIDQSPCRKDNCFRFCEGDNSKTAKKIKERFISDRLNLCKYKTLFRPHFVDNFNFLHVIDYQNDL